MSDLDTIVDLAAQRIRRMSDAELLNAISDTCQVIASLPSQTDRDREVPFLHQLLADAARRQLPV